MDLLGVAIESTFSLKVIFFFFFFLEIASSKACISCNLVTLRYLSVLSLIHPPLFVCCLVTKLCLTRDQLF